MTSLEPTVPVLEGDTPQLKRTLAAARYEEVVKRGPHRRYALGEAKVLEDAKGKVTDKGGDISNKLHVLGQHELQFGKYEGATFCWLMSNDVGYAAYIAIETEKEKRTDAPLSKNKFALLKYVKEIELGRRAMDIKKATATASPQTRSAQPLKDRELLEAVEAIERQSASSQRRDLRNKGPWLAKLPVHDREWARRALFKVNEEGIYQFDFAKINRVWFHPPSPALVVDQPPKTDLYFARPIFMWMPRRLKNVNFICPSCTKTLTGAGVYENFRRVIGLNGDFTMITKKVECKPCNYKRPAWDEVLMRQLEPAMAQCEFPCIMTRKLACKKELITLVRHRGIGNGVARLQKNLAEVQYESWAQRSCQYLSDCEPFAKARDAGTLAAEFGSLPEPPQVPSLKWLGAVFTRDVLSRLKAIKAGMTAIHGRILKLDSTKKIVRKLHGEVRGPAAFLTHVGNELGQILISVATSSEGTGLNDMIGGLQTRYKLSGTAPPVVLYVDRDCCGTFRIKPKFSEWPEMQVKLDIWHLMRRIALCCVSELHEKYVHFIRQLSASILEWNEDDLNFLKSAVRQQSVGLSSTWLSPTQVSSHCKGAKTARV